MQTINIFHLGDAYYFKHYFERRDLFDELRSYYDSLEYRFKLKEEDLGEVREKLRSHDFDINIVEGEEISDYVVVINKYEKHKDLLRNSVDTIELGSEKALLLKDKVAKEEALDRGREPDEEWLERF